MAANPEIVDFGTFEKGEFWRDLPDPPKIAGKVFPPAESVLRVFRDGPEPEKIKVVILGQDPYPDAGRANGFCFAVNDGCDIPVSLQRIVRELFEEYDLKYNLKSIDEQFAFDYTLSHWARQGVFLLNTALTVAPGAAGSHLSQWEDFTTAVMKRLGEDNGNRVFILWGNHAKNYSKYISNRHLILTSAHPASRNGGFSGNKHFVSANNYLVKNDMTPIFWINPKQTEVIIKKIEMPLPVITPQNPSRLQNIVAEITKITAEVKNLKVIRDEMREVSDAAGEFKKVIDKFSELIDEMDDMQADLEIILRPIKNKIIEERLELIKQSVEVAREDVDVLTEAVRLIVSEAKKK
jgi:uracil-DNA glycosylase